MAEAPAPLDKAEVARNWKVRSRAWNHWAAHMERMAERFNQPLLDAAEVSAGQRLLDLASGVGEPALSAARRVGPEGSVTATDLVPEMLDGARRRAAEAGLDNMEFRVADMEALPFDDAAFDRLTCRFGIMFCPEPVSALKEACRVLRAGGRAAWMVWGPLSDTTMFNVIQHQVRAALGLDPPGDLPQFRFGSAGLLSEMLASAGFAEVGERELRFTPRPSRGERFWQAPMEMSFGAELAELSDAERAEVDGQVEEAFSEFLDGGEYRLAAHVRIGTGLKPK